MALIDETVTYTGKDALGFWSEAIFKAPSVGLFNVIPGVKNKVKIGIMSVEDLLQSDSCAWTEAGDYTLAQKTIEVCDYKINTTICEKDIEPLYLSALMKAGANNDETAPADFLSYLDGLIKKTTSLSIEDKIWNNDSTASPADCNDGLLKQFADDATVIDVTKATLSASNIQTELGKVYAAIPAEIIGDDDLIIGISKAATKFFMISLLSSNPALYAANNVNMLLMYGRVKIVTLPALPDNEMVALKTSNVSIATDLAEDIEDIQYLPMRQNSGERSIRVSAYMKIGAGYANGAEVVYYH